MKRNLSIFFLLVLISAIFIFKFHNAKKDIPSPERSESNPHGKDVEIKNVLFLSFCSVNANHLPIFGIDVSEKDYPNMSKLFNSSFNYTNAYTNLSWSNTARYFFSHRPIGTLIKKSGILDAVENGIKVNYIHVGGELDINAEYKQYFTDERINLPLHDLDSITEEIDKRNVDTSLKQLWVVHFKIMHYPYLSNFYLSSPKIMKSVFNEKELSLIKEYTDHPEKYPDKLAFFQITFGNKKFEKLFFNKQNQYMAFVTDKKAVARWRDSSNSEIDLSILRKSYNMRLKTMDELVGKLLDYYSKIERNTVLIASGDHGETITEHNYFSHGFIPYDEVIRFFHSVHFPFQKQKKIINTQISQKTISDAVKYILHKGITENIFLASQNLQAMKDDYIMSFNCTGDIASVRIKNRWKFIYFINEDRYELFDLISDPAESIDVSKINLANENLSSALKIDLMDILATRQVSKESCFK